jgi:putative SOS response-associated peptidase YedK
MTLILHGLRASIRPGAIHKDAPDRWLWSAAIIAGEATGPAGEIHDRTPVILPADRVDACLDPTQQEPAAIAEVLDGIRPPVLGMRAVSREVNRVGTNGPQLIAPLRVDDVDQTIQLSHVA